MENKKYLNEEQYQKTSKNLFKLGIGIIILGFVVATIMFILKLDFGPKVSKEELRERLAQLKPNLQEKYNELEANGFKESWDYKNEEGYEMTLIDIALDPRYSTCESSTIYSDHDTTREYCEVKQQIYELDKPKTEPSILFKIVPSFMVLMPCIAIGAMFILTSKRREITAYATQQVMPVTKEGIEEMTPTVRNATKEIVKGIKEVLKDEE